MKKFLSIIIALAIIATFAIIPASAASVVFPNVVINDGYATFYLTVTDSTGVGSIDVDFSVSGGTIESITSGQGMVSGTSHASFMANGEPSSVSLAVKVKASGNYVTLSFSGLEVSAGATGSYAPLSATSSGSAKAEAPATTTTTKPTTTKAPKPTAAPVAPTKAPEKKDDTTTTTKKTDDVTKETTTAKVEKRAELNALKVVANSDVAVTLVPGTYDYDITVPNGTKSLTVDASALDDATVEVIGNDNISDGSVVNINVTSKDGVSTVYKVKVTYADEQQQARPIIQRDGVSKGLVIIIAIALFFLGLILGLLIGFLIGKKRFENVDYFGGDDGYSGGFVSGSADDDDVGVVSPFQTSGFNFESAGGMGLNYDFANDDFEESADDAVSLRDPVYSEPETPAFEMAADEPAPAVNVPPVAPVIPVAEPVAAPAPVVEPVVEPTPAYTAPEPAYAAPAPAYAPVEPVAPVAEPAPAYTAPEPAYAAPVAEPVAPVVEPTSAEPVSGIGLINSALNDAPAAPVAEPVAPVAEPVAPVIEPVAPVVEPVAPVAEPVATPYIDDAPPVLPYEAGKAFGSVPFEQSAD